MWFKKQKRSIFATRAYKIDRSGRFKNPASEQKREWGSRLFKILNIVLIVPTVAAIYFIFFSPFYTVRNIDVRGTTTVPADDVLDIVRNHLAGKTAGILPNDNLWLVTQKSIYDALAPKFLVKSVTLNRKPPDTIIISVVERVPALYWRSNNSQFLIDTDGIAIKEIYSAKTPLALFNLQPVAEGQSAPKPPVMEDDFLSISEITNTPVALGDGVISDAHITAIQEVYEALTQRQFGTITALSVPHKFPQSFIVEFDNSWQIFVNLNDNVKKQLERLDLVIQEKIGKSRLKELEYIDLKLGESVYFRFKQTPQ